MLLGARESVGVVAPVGLMLAASQVVDAPSCRCPADMDLVQRELGDRSGDGRTRAAHRLPHVNDDGSTGALGRSQGEREGVPTRLLAYMFYVEYRRPRQLGRDRQLPTRPWRCPAHRPTPASSPGPNRATTSWPRRLTPLATRSLIPSFRSG